MRPNLIKQRLSAGETAFGTMVFELLSAGLPEMLSRAGAEFVFYDMEHSGFSYAEIKHQLALCRGLELVPIVRPRAASLEHTTQLLDLGAMGLLFQTVETAAQAEELVRLTRYPPNGHRSAMFGGAHSDYGAQPVPDVIASADDRTMVCVLIESERGLANVEEIMSVPGVDVGHLGHGDLSLSLGVPGDTGHPRVQAAIDALVEACEYHGKAAGCLSTDATSGIEWARRGFRMISVGYDVGLLSGALSNGINAVRAALGNSLGNGLGNEA